MNIGARFSGLLAPLELFELELGQLGLARLGLVLYHSNTTNKHPPVPFDASILFFIPDSVALLILSFEQYSQ